MTKTRKVALKIFVDKKRYFTYYFAFKIPVFQVKPY